MLPLRVVAGLLAVALLARWRNERAWADAERSLAQAADLWAERLRQQDAREDRMVGLAARQVRLGWIALGVAGASLMVALVVAITGL